MIFFVYIIAFLLAVSILILVHEFGHFLVARLFQVRVERFSIGFGKPLYIWKSKNGFTKYCLSPLVLGGYVKLLDTREIPTSSRDCAFAFDHKSILQRFAIVCAGPLANVIFAVFAFWLMLTIGFKLPKPIIGKVIPNSVASHVGLQSNEEILKVDDRDTENWGEVVVAMLSRVGDGGYLNLITQGASNKTKMYELDLSQWKIDAYDPDPLNDFGIEEYKPQALSIVYKVAKNSPAEKGGLQVGDLIIAVAGKKVSDWEEFLHEIRLYPKQTITLSIKRAAKYQDLAINTGWKFGKGWKKIGFIGVNIDLEKIVWREGTLREYKYGVFSAFLPVLRQMRLFVDLNNIIFGKLLVGKMPLRILGGPIATFVASGQALEQGFVTFLGFLAVISLTIAFVNILPLPGLDGGYLFLLLIEAIRGRPISIRTQNLIFRLGIALFVLLILQATGNDLMRLLS